MGLLGKRDKELSSRRVPISIYPYDWLVGYIRHSHMLATETNCRQRVWIDDTTYSKEILEMELYNLGKVPWDESQLIYSCLGRFRA